MKGRETRQRRRRSCGTLTKRGENMLTALPVAGAGGLWERAAWASVGGAHASSFPTDIESQGISKTRRKEN